MMTGNDLLELLKSNGIITALDFYLANFLHQKANINDPQANRRFAFLLAWLSLEVRSGHVCIDLTQLTKKQFDYRIGRELSDSIFTDLDKPKLTDWLKLCAEISHDIISDGQNLTPLILCSNRLYFQRMWLYEKRVAQYFALNQHSYHFEDKTSVCSLIDTLFPSTNSVEIDWQKVAVVSALTHKIAIISGGPGTGKTTTISKLLTALLTINQENTLTNLRIVATAPTGKAAARLTESLSSALSSLTIPEPIKSSLPTEAITLHRLLGARPNSNQYLYNEHNLLNIDLLLIDEASMVDLPMMAKIINALPEHCRLILLGDKEQLSSVEAGAVFADLCQMMEQGYSQNHIDTIYEICQYRLESNTQHQANFADCVCLLQKSYRFNLNSGIGVLANYIKEGQNEAIEQLFKQNKHHDIVLNPLVDENHYIKAIQHTVSYYSHYLLQILKYPTKIQHILTCFAEFRLLCALREGRYGVSGLNKIIEQELEKQNIIHRNKNQAWYVGRPIMILRNSFSLGLFNGDIGITLPDPHNKDKLRVYFSLPSGEIKGFAPYRLPEHETAYAMTIHKSQGSEFDHISIILPTEYSPLLTRSLLYTAVTRAKKNVAIFADNQILSRTVLSKTQRQSGLLHELENITANLNKVAE